MNLLNSIDAYNEGHPHIVGRGYAVISALSMSVHIFLVRGFQRIDL